MKAQAPRARREESLESSLVVFIVKSIMGIIHAQQSKPFLSVGGDLFG